MAETQTINLEEGQPEFSPEELDSLQVGEKMLEEEQQMLAGKFKDAEALEQAYIELQKKLGEKNSEETNEPEETEENTKQVINTFKYDRTIITFTLLAYNNRANFTIENLDNIQFSFNITIKINKNQNFAIVSAIRRP